MLHSHAYKKQQQQKNYFSMNLFVESQNNIIIIQIGTKKYNGNAIDYLRTFLKD